MPEARPTDKSPDAFRTISEVAEDLELPQHVLRFWETRFTQIKPIKRAGGRRFYRPEDVDLLRGVRHLLYSEGYTIKGVQRILKEQGIHYVQDLAIEEEAAAFQPTTSIAARGRGPETAAPRRREPEPEPDLDEAPYATDIESNPRQRAASRGGAEAGGALGGFLGLLPRRKVRAEPTIEEPPVIAELPFPEFSQHTRRHEEPVEPRLEPAPRARSAPQPVERPSESRRASPPPEPRFEREDEAEFFRRVVQEEFEGRDFDDRDLDGRDFDGDAMRDPPPQRAVPSFAPEQRHEAGRERRAPIPQRRPSRGPASRLSEPAPVPELEDPLLPFFDDDAFGPDAPQISEPLDARIRRLKEHVPGPPEEYIPARARRGESERQEAGPRDRDVAFRPDMRSGEMRGEERRPPLGPSRGPAALADDWPEEWREDQPLRALEPRGGHGPASGFQGSGPEAGTPARRAESRGPAMNVAPLRADERGDGQRIAAQGSSWTHAAPAPRPAPPGDETRPRIGPLTGPLEEYVLEDPEPLRWDHHQGFRPEAAPREPHRPGPPEQYLPPHLRSEPRVSGAPPAPTPVLSRDDVHRLQATLYELGECLRLLGGAVEHEDESTL